MKKILIKFLNEIRDYEIESRNMVGFDERDTEEFVDIFLNKDKPTFNALNFEGFKIDVFPSETQERGKAVLIFNPNDLMSIIK